MVECATVKDEYPTESDRLALKVVSYLYIDDDDDDCWVANRYYTVLICLDNVTTSKF